MCRICRGTAISVGKKVYGRWMQPTFVFDSPQLGENIGAAARGMRNFGLDRMRLVSPRDGWPNPKAFAAASGAGMVLANAGIFDDLETALGEFQRVYATTARRRELTKQVMTPKAAMVEARELMKRGVSVAVLFGSERAGLENKSISFASAVISVPAIPEFSSLNLAQCALLVGYEWRLSEEIAVEPVAISEVDEANVLEKAALADKYAEALKETGFFDTAQNEEGKRINLRNLFLRHDFTVSEVKTLHGIRRFLSVRRHRT